MQPEDFAAVADVIAQAIQEALAPVLERLAVIEARLDDTTDTVAALGQLRERVAVVETKAAMSAAPPTPAIDLSPVLARLTATEARVETLGDLRDRLVAVETKAAWPSLPDAAVGALQDRVLALEHPAPLSSPSDVVLERLAAADARMALWSEHAQALRELRDNVLVLETKAAMPTPVTLATQVIDPEAGLVDLRARLGALEQTVDTDGARLEGHQASLQRDAAALRERIAVLETRAPVPGPAGRDGVDGKDGADGLGFGDLSVTQDGERAFTVRATHQGETKELGTLTFPVEIYRGVYLDGKTYDRGDRVTWAGSEWHCNEPTATKPGDGSKAWTLTVKRGRDGKDGIDAPGALPVVSVGRPRT